MNLVHRQPIGESLLRLKGAILNLQNAISSNLSSFILEQRTELFNMIELAKKVSEINRNASVIDRHISNNINIELRNAYPLLHEATEYLVSQITLKENIMDTSTYLLQFYKKYFLEDAILSLEDIIDALEPKIEAEIEGWEDLEAFSDQVKEALSKLNRR